MVLAKEEILHIAKLANLTLSDDDVSKLGSMLGQTIDYVKVLTELDTSEVDETYQVTGLKNVFQKEDAPATTLTQDDALNNAREKIKNMFATKAIFKR